MISHPAQARCVGDCGGDRTVTIDDLLTVVNIALDHSPVTRCPAGEEPGAGRMRLLRNPVRFGAAKTSVRRFPRRLGEHTDELLREAGYDAEEIATLRNGGVVS